MVFESRSYRSVSSSESFHDEEGYEPTNAEKVGLSPLRLRNMMGKNWILSPRFLLLSHLATSTFYLLIISTLWHQSSSLENCAQQLSTWSPALPAVKYKKPELFKAEVFQTNAFRGPQGQRPPKEVDELWNSVGVGMPGLRLSGEEIKGLGKELVDGTKTQHAMPDGKGGYIAMLEVFHMLHCLDELRKALFYNWDYYSPGHNASLTAIQNHHDHCVDALRLSLMCTSDVTPVTFFDDSDVPQRRTPFPDFSTKHTCRDFDAIAEWSWQTERAVMWEDIGDATTWDPSTGADTAGHSPSHHNHQENVDR